MKLALVGVSVLGTSLLLACGSSSTSVSGPPAPPACTTNAECTSTPETAYCDTVAKVCAANQSDPIFRNGVTFTVIHKLGAAAKPSDLGFSADGELWVVGYGDNSIHRGTGITTESPTFKRILDPAAGHFMLKPPALAIGAPGSFATCGDNLNERGGGDGPAAHFMGPALFSTDPAILGVSTAGGLGSHLDMLHNTPLCRGIAHEKANIFWVFNSLDRSLDKYNFNEPHPPGGDDHSDGTIYRYAMGKVKGADGTPSHVFFDASDNFLYVADTGNARVVRLDTTTGKKGGSLERYNEPLKDEGVMTGTDVEEIVAPGTLTKPSGLEIYNDLLYVTDTATSTFHIFDKTGKEIGSFPMELPAGSLAGLAFGPDQKLYFVDKVGGAIYRADSL